MLDDLASALIATAAEVVETGNPGKVTLTLAVKPEGQGEPLVIVTPSLSHTTPKRELRGALFFAVEGGLHREDPRQMKIEFRTVNTETGEIVDVPTEQTERSVSS